MAVPEFGYMGAPTTALFKVDATAAGDGGSGGWEPEWPSEW